MEAIQFYNISLTLNNTPILDNVSFDVKKGEIYGLIGHNGAGKTSLLKILLGLTKNYKGKIKLFSNEDLGAMRGKLGAVIDLLGIDKALTASQYIRRIGDILNIGAAVDEKAILGRVGLADTGKKEVGKFSLGMKRRLLVAGALIGNPELLVLDEPFNGIDSEGMAELRLVLHQLSSEGTTVLVTSHNIPELIKLSTRFGVMYKGTFVGEISEAELSQKRCFKTVFKTGTPQLLVAELKQKYPQLETYANSPGEIAVFGEVDNALCREIRSTLINSEISDVSTARMSEEEVLLWKMNGHAD